MPDTETALSVPGAIPEGDAMDVEEKETSHDQNHGDPAAMNEVCYDMMIYWQK